MSVLTRALRGSVITVFAIVIVLTTASVASAYSRANAATYADSRWNVICDGSTPCFTNDCANFVSLSMYNGGYPFHNPYVGATNDNNWWYKMGPDYSFINTNSWSLVPHQMAFLLSDGGTWATPYSQRGDSTAYDSGGYTGDPIYYDWDGDQHSDHVGIITGYGWSRYHTHYGDYVDAHSNNRYHEFWTLIDYNTSWRTTGIIAIHVNP